MAACLSQDHTDTSFHLLQSPNRSISALCQYSSSSVQSSLITKLPPRLQITHPSSSILQGTLTCSWEPQRAAELWHSEGNEWRAETPAEQWWGVTVSLCCSAGVGNTVQTSLLLLLAVYSLKRTQVFRWVPPGLIKTECDLHSSTQMVNPLLN